MNKAETEKFYLDFTEEELRQLLVDWLFFPYKNDGAYDQDKELQITRDQIKESTLRFEGDWVVIVYSNGVENYVRYNENKSDKFDYQQGKGKRWSSFK